MRFPSFRFIQRDSINELITVEDGKEGDNDVSSEYHHSANELLDVMTISKNGNAQIQTVGAESEEFQSIDQPQSWKEKLIHLYDKEGLLVEVLVSIVLARIYPKLGAVYCFPEITAHVIAVIVIFFFSGFSLKLNELSDAASNPKFNAFVIIYNFLGNSIVVNIVAKFLFANEIVSEDLMKGMVICSCLAMPTNMMVVLTISCNGDEAKALFLATFMNLLGVFFSPLLIFFYLQENAEIDFVKTYKSIGMRVLLPVTMGLLFRLKIPKAEAFATTHKRFFLKIRERCLVFIVYATFCTTFMVETNSTRLQITVMAISQVILLAATMVISWILLFTFFNKNPKLRVVGLFGCSTKTAALGIPLISALYEDSPRLGIYTLPLLIWYPSQLIIGTMLSSRLSKFVDYKLNKFEIESQIV